MKIYYMILDKGIRVGPIYEHLKTAESRVSTLQDQDFDDGDANCHEYEIEETPIIPGVFIIRD